MQRSLWTSWLVAVSLNFLSTSAQEVAVNVAFPGTVGVELLFPLNDTYGPTRYMPFVSSISNPELAEVLNLDVTFDIYDTIDYTNSSIDYKEINIPSANLSSVASKIRPHLAPTLIIHIVDFEGGLKNGMDHRLAILCRVMECHHELFDTLSLNLCQEASADDRSLRGY
jgi:hypothetical protein